MSETRVSLIQRLHNLADRDAWNEFWALYQSYLLGVLREQGLQQVDADDVSQEIYLKLRGAMQNFQLDHAKGRFHSWLWRFAFTTAVDWYRRRSKERKFIEKYGQQVGNNLLDCSRSQPDSGSQQQHRRMILEYVSSKVRERVKPKTWQCFIQRVQMKRPAKDVAAELGITTNEVHVNASRVLKQLRQKCAEFGEELGMSPAPADSSRD